MTNVPKTVDLIKEILEKCYLMSLATLDDGGVWVSDVIFVHDEDLNIYWISDPDVRHSKAIIKDNKVYNVIYAGKFDNEISHEVDSIGLNQGEIVAKKEMQGMIIAPNNSLLELRTRTQIGGESTIRLKGWENER